MRRRWRQHRQIDRSRVYATGHSNGGQMAYRLAFEMPGQFAAVAPISANIPVASNLDCETSGQPVSVAIFSGTNDPVNPYNAGLVEVMGDIEAADEIWEFIVRHQITAAHQGWSL